MVGIAGLQYCRRSDSEISKHFQDAAISLKMDEHI